MPDEELWALNLRINKRRDEPSAIRNGELRARGRCAHVVPGGVVANPAENTRHRRIESSRHQECHSVLDPVGFDIGNHCIPDDGQRKRREHNGATKAEMVGEEGNANCDT